MNEEQDVLRKVHVYKNKTESTVHQSLSCVAMHACVHG